MQEKYSWLGSSDERKYVSDKELLEKYVKLLKSCQTDKERNRLWICYISTKMHSA